MEEIPISHGYTDNNRGIRCCRYGAALITDDSSAHRANGELAYHVLEAMHGIHDASRDGKHYTMESILRGLKPMPVLEKQSN